MEELDLNDCHFILDSLKYTQHKFENYSYPTYKMKRERLDEVYAVILKVRAIRDRLKEAQNENRT